MLRERSGETSVQKGVSFFQCARTYPAPTEQKCGHKRTLGFPCSACSFRGPDDTLLLLPRQRRRPSASIFEIEPASAVKRGPVDHTGPVGTLCDPSGSMRY